MDQTLVAMAALVVFAAIGLGYYVGIAERDSRRRWPDHTEHGDWPL